MKTLSNHSPPTSQGSTTGPGRISPAIGALLLSLCVASAQGTITVTFDGPPIQPPRTATLIQYYHESGVWFRPIPGTDGFIRRGSPPEADYWPDDGTTYILASLGDSLTFGMDDGSDFGLLSVDLAGWNTVYPEPVTVPFVGYRRDGSTITTSFTTDWITDPLAAFRTFNFPAEFSGVYQVRIPDYGWSLDNLGFRVPEPGTGALFVAAAALLSVRFLRHKRRG